MRNFIPSTNITSNSNYPPHFSYQQGGQTQPSNFYGPNYPVQNSYQNERNYEELKSFYQSEFERNRNLIMQECQNIIRKELEFQTSRFNREKEELHEKIYEKDRELAYFRSENKNSNHESFTKNEDFDKKIWKYCSKNTSKSFDNNYHKNKTLEKQQKDEKITDKVIYEFEHKINNIEKSINELKSGLTQKEKNVKDRVYFDNERLHTFSGNQKEDDLIHKLEKQLEKSNEENRYLTLHLENMFQTLNGYQKYVKELELTASNKNRTITQKLTNLNADIKKHQRLVDKVKHKDKRWQSDND